MTGVCYQHEPPYSQLFCASLVNFIGAEVEELVLIRLWCTGNKLLEFPRLAFTHLLHRQADLFAICDSE